jgi:Spy/CpxP family protein refolding chaperone
MKKIFVLLFLFSLISFAQEERVVVREIESDDDEMGMPMPRGGHGMMMKQLNLSDDQQKQFDKLHDEMEKKQIDLRAKVKSLRVDLKGLFRDDKPDQAKIESKIAEISKLQTEMKLAHIGFWFNVNKLLNAEQQKVWKRHAMMMGREKMNGMMHKPLMKKKMRMMKEPREDDD